MDICLPCLVGLPNECYKPNGKRCSLEIDLGETANKRGGPFKQDFEVTDPKSTGRKRAAVLLPLKDSEGNGYVCSWAQLRHAGGGEFPIIGCLGNIATNRHHGPDKDTLNNDEVGRNLHRICTFCHNRWHTLNDATYTAYIERVGLTGIQAHDPKTRATPEELSANEARWGVKK